MDDIECRCDLCFVYGPGDGRGVWRRENIFFISGSSKYWPHLYGRDGMSIRNRAFRNLVGHRFDRRSRKVGSVIVRHVFRGDDSIGLVIGQPFVKHHRCHQRRFGKLQRLSDHHSNGWHDLYRNAYGPGNFYEYHDDGPIQRKWIHCEWKPLRRHLSQRDINKTVNRR